MAGKEAGIESAAIGVLKRAVELDSELRFDEAVICYHEGLQLLLDVVRASQDENKKQRIRKKISEYMDRAEHLKVQAKQVKEDGKYHEQIHIEHNSTGHSFENIFGRFLDKSVSEVEVEDPYIRNVHQIYNFLRFCEVVVKSKANVKVIHLLTGQDGDSTAQSQQICRLNEITRSLHNHGIQLKIDYSQTLHDREVRFNTGWIIKIGRGLDYFKASDGKFSIGFCDFDLRPCHETTIDIFHSSHTKPG